MIGNLFQLAKQDAAFFAGTSGDWQTEFTITTPDGLTSYTGSGLSTGTWKEFMEDSKGKPANSTSFSIDIPEAQLISASYPYKINGIINIQGHGLQLNDGASLTGNFVIAEQHRNATLGLIVCTLGRAS